MKFLDKMILCIFSVLILLMAVISSACIFGWIDTTGLYVFVTKALADQYFIRIKCSSYFICNKRNIF